MAIREINEGGNDIPFDLDTRGWAMRRGHSKALLRRRKVGAPCAFRGRNSFSRTVNVSTRWHRHSRFAGCPDEASRARMKRETRREIVGELALVKLGSHDHGAHLEGAKCERLELSGCHSLARENQFGSTNWCIPAPHMQPDKHANDTVANDVRFSEQQNLHDFPKKIGVGMLRTRSTPCTACEVRDAEARASKAYVPLAAWRYRGVLELNDCLGLENTRNSAPEFSARSDRKNAWRWEEAIARAADAAQVWRRISSDAVPALPTRKQIRLQEMQRLEKEHKFWQRQRELAWTSRKESRRESRFSRKQSNVTKSVQECLDAHQSLVKNGADVSELEGSIHQVFDSFLANFLQRHRSRILSSLSSFRPCQGNIELQPAKVSLLVQLRFLKALVQLGASVSLQPVLHGTRTGNIPSIFARGLLIPGKGNEIRVANGSAHGLGIYTANLSHASLSYGFGGSKGILVCGVLDDAETIVEPQAIGRLRVTAESAAVRHVGGAIVVFDERRVVPLLHVAMPRLASKGHGRPDLCRQKQNKKKLRTAEIAQRHSQKTHADAVVARRPARRRTMCRGLNRSGVGAFGLASHQ